MLFWHYGVLLSLNQLIIALFLDNVMLVMSLTVSFLLFSVFRNSFLSERQITAVNSDLMLQDSKTSFCKRFRKKLNP